MASSDWTEGMVQNWMGMQQQYWDTWGNMVKASSSQPNGTMNMPPWSQALDSWWSNSASAAPTDISDVMARISDMGKMYMSMAEMMYQSSNGQAAFGQGAFDPANFGQAGFASPDKGALEMWMSMMESGFKDWSKQIAQGNIPDQGMGIGPMHFEGWQKVLKTLGMDTMSSMGSFGVSNSQGWQDQLRKMLSTPGVGYSRESQEQLQHLAQLMMDYQEAMNDYTEAFSQQGVDSIQALRDHIEQLSKEGKEIASLRELFDLWINVNEEVYAEFAMSDQYQVVYGDMVNAFMKLKAGINDQVEILYKAANLPTRTEFNAALSKQQVLKRENRSLRNTLKDVLKRVEALENAAASQEASQASSSSKASVSSATKDKPKAKAASKPKPKADTKEAPQQEQVNADADNTTETLSSILDDLTQIKGLGPKMNEKLYEAGIKSFMELSEVSLDKLEQLDKKLGSQGRILRDDWVGQAKAFASKTKG